MRIVLPTKQTAQISAVAAIEQHDATERSRANFVGLAYLDGLRGRLAHGRAQVARANDHRVVCWKCILVLLEEPCCTALGTTAEFGGDADDFC